MRLSLRVTGVLTLAVLLAAPAASAGTNDNAKILLHLLAPTLKNQCTRPEAGPPCASAITAGDLYPHMYYAYVLVGDVNSTVGLAGLQFGIEYAGASHSGVDIFNWVLCATLQFQMPGWPATGTGNLITWDRTTVCQLPGGNSAVAGYFYLAAYSPDELRIVPRQADGYAKVADCQAVESILVGPGYSPPVYPLGRATFAAGGGTSGYNPCGGGVAPTCSIQGPDAASANGSALTYSVTVSDPLATVSWSITGNGSFLGGTGGSSVQVSPGAPGSFTLTVNVSSTSAPGSCSKTVSLTEGCSISGPASLEAWQSASYTAFANVDPPVTYVWSISGAGTINSTSGDMADVTGTTGSSFTLNVSFTNGAGATGNCARTVTITPPFQCTVYGPGTLTVNQVGTYSVPLLPTGAAVAWSVSGNAVIIGSSNGSSVSVLGTALGPATVQAIVTTSTNTSTCHEDVSVNSSEPQPRLNANARILVHLASPTLTRACTRSEALPTCSQVKANGKLYPDSYFAYVIVANGYTSGTTSSGIAGVQFGIRFDGAAHSGVDILDWTLCATLQFPQTDWPASNSGNLVTWDPTNNCQNTEPAGPGTGVVATVGYFYLSAYSEDRLRIIPRPVDGFAKVASCDAVESTIDSATNPASPSPLGDAYFSASGTQWGYVPCGLNVPVVPATWSQIKTMYGR